MLSNAVIAQLLHKIANLEDCSDLFAALGYRPSNQELAENLKAIATWRGFKILAARSDKPIDAAKRNARQSRSHNQRTLAVAVGKGKMVLAAPRIGVPGITRTLELSLESPTAYALHQLQLLRPIANTTALAHSLRVAEVLDAEPAGDRFFKAFRLIFDRMVDAGAQTIPEDDRRTLALLSLTRLLFLYFVQAKGWLDGKQDYIHTLFDKTLARRKAFHLHALNPLFFGTLNKPPDQRRIRGLGAIPYLNGGLFERHPAERQWPRATFTNELWRDALDDLFERFRFCVREASEVDTIAPDMLGRVFERLGEGERASTGTFYTPEIIVRQIVDATLEAALSSRSGISESAAHEIVCGTLADERIVPIARRATRSIRLLDPAVGSGAFLLGALESLSRIRQTLASRKSDGLGRIRRHVLRENLFGVDINPIAVRLTELRLWLAIVADDPETDVFKVNPLPNLNGVVRQGDTLVDPISGLGSADLTGRPSLGSLRELHFCRRGLFDARGAERSATLSRLRTIEHGIARQILTESRSNVRYAIADLEAVADGSDLFGFRSGLTREQQFAYHRLTAHCRELDKSLDAVNEGRLPFFSFEVHAPQVMQRGGFDVVVGNPPWVRAERLSPEKRSMLQQRFSWWRSRSSPGYSHQPDLAVAFLQRALELTAPGGAVGLLVPSKIATADYAHEARHHMVRETTLRYLHRVPDSAATSFGATTYPLAIVAQKVKPSSRSRTLVGFNRKYSVDQASLAADGIWVLLGDVERRALDRLRAAGPPLARIARCSLGVKTGADSVFVGELVCRSRTTSTIEIEKCKVAVETRVTRPAIRGRDIAPFRCAAGRVLIWGYDCNGVLLRKLPPLAERHVASHRLELASRSDYKKGPLWQLFRTRIAEAPQLLVWSDISRTPRSVVIVRTSTSPIPLNTCYAMTHSDMHVLHAIACLMNSTWVAALVRSIADEARGGYRRVNARVVRAIPIPDDVEQLRLLADLSFRAHKSHVDQDEIDATAAKALRLPAWACRTLRSLADG